MKSITLFLPWSVYGFEIDGRPVIDWFLEKRGGQLTDKERAWLEAQRRAWFSIWEVENVRPGEGIDVVDLLTGVRRHVHDVSASRTMVLRDTILARVVEDGGAAVMSAYQDNLLPPGEAAAVEDRLRRELRFDGDVPIARLQEAACGRALIAAWEDGVAEAGAMSRIQPRLQNTDGDEVELIQDRWTFDAAAHDDIAARIEALEGVERSGDSPGKIEYVVLKPGNAQHSDWKNTIVGELTLEDTSLTIETNSQRRAEVLRERIEAACGAQICGRERAARRAAELMKPKTFPEDEPPAAALHTEAARQERERKQAYYERWLDLSLPGLGGKTPRQAAASPESRRKIEVMLKVFENDEARLPEAERMDVQALRTRIGL